MKTLYLYKTSKATRGRKNQFLPMATIFDGPEEDAQFFGEIVAKDEESLLEITNRFERSVWLNPEDKS